MIRPHALDHLPERRPDHAEAIGLPQAFRQALAAGVNMQRSATTPAGVVGRWEDRPATAPEPIF